MRIEGETQDFALCADDYGMSPAVSRGVLQAAQAGVISAASAMTNMPDWPRAAEAWAQAAPSVDLGLHVTLTCGRLLTAPPRLARDGVAPKLSDMIALHFSGRFSGVLDEAEIQAEIGAQIDAFVLRFGRSPTHIDGHQHVHALPGVRRALFNALAERGLRDPWLRDSADRLAKILARDAMKLKAMQVACLTAGFRAAARARGFHLNDSFAGFSDFRDSGYDKLFPSYLRARSSRHLVMCHPGYVDDVLRALDPVTDSRKSELRFLLSDAYPALLGAQGARLMRPSDWPRLNLPGRGANSPQSPAAAH